MKNQLDQLAAPSRKEMIQDAKNWLQTARQELAYAQACRDNAKGKRDRDEWLLSVDLARATVEAREDRLQELQVAQ